MHKRIATFLKTPASINIIINTVGNYISLFFTVFFVVTLTRALQPAEYGVLNVLLSISYVMANVLDFGTTATIYSYLPPLLTQQRSHLYRFVKSTFIYQTVFSGSIVLILALIFPYADQEFFKTGAPHWILFTTSVSILLLVWQNFITNMYFAAKKFLLANIYNNVSNIIKSVLLFGLVYFHHADIGSIILIFGIIGPLVFFAFVITDRYHVFSDIMRAPFSLSELRFDYTFKYFMATQLFTLGSRMDLFILSHYSNPNTKADVGYYALAQKIILTIITFIVSITQVLSPGFTHVKTRPEAKKQLKHAFLYLAFPAALFVILFFVPKQLYVLIFTHGYADQTVQITQQLALPFILYALGSAPLLFLLYTVKKPLYILVSNLIYFFIMTIGCFWYIPIKGVFAPPLIIFVSLFIAVVLQAFAAVYEYRKLPSR